MPRSDVTIKTRDGLCPASFFTPATGAGPWPGVIFYMDGLGIRPSLWEMAQKLADGGYAVLLPDLYYRIGPYPPMNPAQIFTDPAGMDALRKLVGSLDRDRKISDTGAFIDDLAARPEVAGDRFCATGYCMGGNTALVAAGAYPDRFAAIASFHGGSLASDQADSPHLFVSKITGFVYVAGAKEDSHFTLEQKALLEQSLTTAEVAHKVEIYPALHGFAVPDMPVYDSAAAERHWTALFSLFKDAFGQG